MKVMYKPIVKPIEEEKLMDGKSYLKRYEEIFNKDSDILLKCIQTEMKMALKRMDSTQMDKDIFLNDPFRSSAECLKIRHKYRAHSDMQSIINKSLVNDNRWRVSFEDRGIRCIPVDKK